MIILRLLLLLTNLHLKLLSTQGTGADKLLSTQRVKGLTLNFEVPQYMNKAIPFIYYLFHITVLPLSFHAGFKICIHLNSLSAK